MKNTLKKKMRVMLALSTLGLVATGAQADWGRDGYGNNHHAYRQSQAFSQQVNARQDRQMERIRAGIHEGRLTRAESRELMYEQREIRAMERHFRADGLIDTREFRRLGHALDLAGRNIMAEKHDRQAHNAYGRPSRFN